MYPKIIILCDRSTTFKSEKHNIMQPVHKVLRRSLFTMLLSQPIIKTPALFTLFFFTYNNAILNIEYVFGKIYTLLPNVKCKYYIHLILNLKSIFNKLKGLNYHSGFILYCIYCMFRHIHTRPKPLDTELVTQPPCSNQQVVIKAMHINTITINQTYRPPYTSLYLCNIYNMHIKHYIKLRHMYMTRRSNSEVMVNHETIHN
jgi:hypothetical protein